MSAKEIKIDTQLNTILFDNAKYYDVPKEILFYIERIQNRYKELYEGFMTTQEELTDYATKNEQLENNRDKAIEMLETYKRMLSLYSQPVNTFDLQDVIDTLKGDDDASTN